MAIEYYNTVKKLYINANDIMSVCFLNDIQMIKIINIGFSNFINKCD